MTHRTVKRFGEYIDKYRLQDAVDDGTTVQILYEGKTADTALKDKAKFDEKVDELAEKYVKSQTGSGHADETTWKQGRAKMWMWVAVTELATVSTIAPSRGADVAEAMLGTAPRKVVIGDRPRSYNRIKRRQQCWAHLRRDFQAMIDRGGKADEVGQRLMEHSDALFGWWHRVRDGTLARSSFRLYVSWLRACLKEDLERGLECGCPRTAGTCRELLSGETHLWTFVRVEGIEPTNNDAERALRHAVIYRKTSGGTDSESGSRFVERMLSVVATCRQQDVNVLDYLTRCDQAHLDGQPAPSLLPASAHSQAG